MRGGALSYIIYTGAVKDGTVGDYTALHRLAMKLGIPCLTSTDTANALAEMIESRFDAFNTELVDINNMRTWHRQVKFAKMQGSGNDYIFIENFDGGITAPESLCVSLCDRHFGIGGDGIVLIERSGAADAKMRSYNRDGSEGKMAGNNIRCVGKYLYDKGYVRSENISIETASGVKRLTLFIRDGAVSSVSVDMGAVSFRAADVPVLTAGEEFAEEKISIGGTEYTATCLSVGNPHCVVFCEKIDELELSKLGPQFEYADIFPERVNTEFVRVVDENTLRLRVWERGNGETMACGTGACAAVAAAVRLGLCREGSDVTVKLAGGDLLVNYSCGRATLTGGAAFAFEGTFEF
jgi:carbamoyl-phosphate synthase large subunit